MLKHTKFANNIAVFILVCIFGYFFYISSARFPVNLLKDISDIKMTMTNVLLLVIGYYFGSSKAKESNNNTYIAPTKNKTMITGYYVDIPANGTIVESVNGDNVSLPFDQYTEATYTAETSTHYGLLEWGNSVEITEVVIDGQPVEVQTLIGGLHPTQRPK